MKRDIMDRMIEWLHAQPDPKGRTFHPLHPETLMVEALFEIERLQRALDYYAERTPSPYAGTGPYDPATPDPGSVARAALEDKWDNA